MRKENRQERKQEEKAKKAEEKGRVPPGKPAPSRREVPAALRETPTIDDLSAYVGLGIAREAPRAQY